MPGEISSIIKIWVTVLRSELQRYSLPITTSSLLRTCQIQSENNFSSSFSSSSSSAKKQVSACLPALPPSCLLPQPSFVRKYTTKLQIFVSRFKMKVNIVVSIIINRMVPTVWSVLRCCSWQKISSSYHIIQQMHVIKSSRFTRCVPRSVFGYNSCVPGCWGRNGRL